MAYLENLAETGEPVGCEDNFCGMIARTFSTSPAEQHLSVCTVAAVEQVLGAPAHCEPVVVFDESRIWLAVATGWWNDLRAFGFGVVDFDIRISDVGLAVRESILRAIEAKLSAPPFRYRTIRKESYVLAVSRFQQCPVLPGFREIATVRVDASEPRVEEPYVDLSVTTTLLLNRQNTGNSSDYRGASESETAVYVQKLREILRLAIRPYCARPERCREMSP